MSASSSIPPTRARCRRLARQYRDQLLANVLPFWQRHSLDRKCGGYFTSLDRRGEVFDTDKFIWLQCRQVWTFSMLYNRLEPRADWLKIARCGADFLRRHGRDGKGDWYFAVDRLGRPLAAPYNIFSDCFAAMAFANYHQATGLPWAKDLARQAYRNVLRRYDDPLGSYSKAVPGSRPMKAFALPMILLNLTVEMGGLLAPADAENTIRFCQDEVLHHHLDRRTGLIHEFVAPDGRKLDCYDGRLLNPGHGIEAMWFLMDLAERRGQADIVKTAVDTALTILDFAWDRTYGGIFYFLDSKGRPPQQLEWDQKLWWVHMETLVALLMAYRLTGRPACWKWFQRVHDYTWPHFPDRRHGEWFGYLNRRGEVLLPLKGGKWKGCFHVPRGLYRCWQELDAM